MKARLTAFLAGRRSVCLPRPVGDGLAEGERGCRDGFFGTVRLAGPAGEEESRDDTSYRPPDHHRDRFTSLTGSA